ncbi:protein kinase domain protein [Toxoplasma gondii VAND]|uniref:Protein kinase domain protein n=1 Tax=Toxoplasma gondii VAND TaxID=933077 RepID=A0A086QIZ9_TOXGO|nr:protein kinase domain protein [Toxoplasma gondii VAND]
MGGTRGRRPARGRRAENVPSSPKSPASGVAASLSCSARRLGKSEDTKSGGEKKGQTANSRGEAPETTTGCADLGTVEASSKRRRPAEKGKPLPLSPPVACAPTVATASPQGTPKSTEDLSAASPLAFSNSSCPSAPRPSVEPRPPARDLREGDSVGRAETHVSSPGHCAGPASLPFSFSFSFTPRQRLPAVDPPLKAASLQLPDDGGVSSVGFEPAAFLGVFQNDARGHFPPLDSRPSLQETASQRPSTLARSVGAEPNYLRPRLLRPLRLHGVQAPAADAGASPPETGQFRALGDALAAEQPRPGAEAEGLLGRELAADVDGDVGLLEGGDGGRKGRDEAGTSSRRVGFARLRTFDKTNQVFQLSAEEEASLLRLAEEQHERLFADEGKRRWLKQWVEPAQAGVSGAAALSPLGRARQTFLISPSPAWGAPLPALAEELTKKKLPLPVASKAVRRLTPLPASLVSSTPEAKLTEPRDGAQPDAQRAARYSDRLPAEKAEVDAGASTAGGPESPAAYGLQPSADAGAEPVRGRPRRVVIPRGAFKSHDAVRRGEAPVCLRFLAGSHASASPATAKGLSSSSVPDAASGTSETDPTRAPASAPTISGVSTVSPPAGSDPVRPVARPLSPAVSAAAASLAPSVPSVPRGETPEKARVPAGAADAVVEAEASPDPTRGGARHGALQVGAELEVEKEDDETKERNLLIFLCSLEQAICQWAATATLCHHSLFSEEESERRPSAAVTGRGGDQRGTREETRGATARLVAAADRKPHAVCSRKILDDAHAFSPLLASSLASASSSQPSKDDISSFWRAVLPVKPPDMPLEEFVVWCQRPLGMNVSEYLRILSGHEAHESLPSTPQSPEALECLPSTPQSPEALECLPSTPQSPEALEKAAMSMCPEEKERDPRSQEKRGRRPRLSLTSPTGTSSLSLPCSFSAGAATEKSRRSDASSLRRSSTSASLSSSPSSPSSSSAPIASSADSPAGPVSSSTSPSSCSPSSACSPSCSLSSVSTACVWQHLYRWSEANAADLGAVLDGYVDFDEERRRALKKQRHLQRQFAIYSKLCSTMRRNFATLLPRQLRTIRAGMFFTISQSALSHGRLLNLVSWQPSESPALPFASLFLSPSSSLCSSSCASSVGVPSSSEEKPLKTNACSLPVASPRGMSAPTVSTSLLPPVAEGGFPANAKAPERATERADKHEEGEARAARSGTRILRQRGLVAAEYFADREGLLRDLVASFPGRSNTQGDRGGVSGGPTGEAEAEAGDPEETTGCGEVTGKNRAAHAGFRVGKNTHTGKAFYYLRAVDALEKRFEDMHGVAQRQRDRLQAVAEFGLFPPAPEEIPRGCQVWRCLNLTYATVLWLLFHGASASLLVMRVSRLRPHPDLQVCLHSLQVENAVFSVRRQLASSPSSLAPSPSRLSSVLPLSPHSSSRREDQAAERDGGDRRDVLATETGDRRDTLGEKERQLVSELVGRALATARRLAGEEEGSETKREGREEEREEEGLPAVQRPGSLIAAKDAYLAGDHLVEIAPHLEDVSLTQHLEKHGVYKGERDVQRVRQIIFLLIRLLEEAPDHSVLLPVKTSRVYLRQRRLVLYIGVPASAACIPLSALLSCRSVASAPPESRREKSETAQGADENATAREANRVLAKQIEGAKQEELEYVLSRDFGVSVLDAMRQPTVASVLGWTEPLDSRLPPECFPCDRLSLTPSSERASGDSPRVSSSSFLPLYPTKPVDVSKAHTWMLGVLLYRIVCGEEKPVSSSVARASLASSSLSAETCPFDLSACSDESARRFLAWCLTPDPRRRPLVRDLLRHPFLAGLGDSYDATVHPSSPLGGEERRDRRQLLRRDGALEPSGESMLDCGGSFDESEARTEASFLGESDSEPACSERAANACDEHNAPHTPRASAGARRSADACRPGASGAAGWGRPSGGSRRSSVPRLLDGSSSDASPVASARRRRRAGASSPVRDPWGRGLRDSSASFSFSAGAALRRTSENTQPRLRGSQSRRPASASGSDRHAREGPEREGETGLNASPGRSGETDAASPKRRSTVHGSRLRRRSSSSGRGERENRRKSTGGRVDSRRHSAGASPQRVKTLPSPLSPATTPRRRADEETRKTQPDQPRGSRRTSARSQTSACASPAKLHAAYGRQGARAAAGMHALHAEASASFTPGSVRRRQRVSESVRRSGREVGSSSRVIGDEEVERVETGRSLFYRRKRDSETGSSPVSQRKKPRGEAPVDALLSRSRREQGGNTRLLACSEALFGDVERMVPELIGRQRDGREDGVAFYGGNDPLSIGLPSEDDEEWRESSQEEDEEE